MGRVWQGALRPFLAVLVVAAAAQSARAGDGAAPVVVELFTSQSCYSCPPAEAFLGELAGEPGIVALEWHVDYWDSLVYGAAGKWKDPFSDPAHTRRQRDYNRIIRGTGSVYTPQMVVDGAVEAVGSRRADVQALVDAARRGEKPARITVEPAPGGALSAEIAGTPPRRSAIWLVRFIDSHTTDVLRGENKGKTLTNHHIVTHVEKLQEWHGGPASFAIDPPPPGEGCALLVQDALSGRVAGAALCGGPPGS